MWKKRLCFAAAAALLGLTMCTTARAVNAKGAVVIEAQSGRVLFGQNEHERLAMASTTKIMTAMLALEQEGLDEEFTVDPQAIRVEGSSMGLTEGDIVTLRTLAAGMLLASGNDAANAAAVRIAGSQDAFVQRMNERAAELELKDTSFETPSGLDGDNHYSTAYDMAMLARAALQNPDFAEICGQYRMTLSYGNPPYKRWLKNHNRLLQDYDGTIGVKTGFTKSAGRCLVSAAQRDGVTLICVTLGCPDDWRTHAQLLDSSFAQVQAADLASLLPELALPVGGGLADSVAVLPAADAHVALAEGEQERVKAEVTLRPFALAPVRAGECVGEACFTLDGEELLRLPLCTRDGVAARPVSEKKTGFWSGLWGRLFGKEAG
ncbi:D-alanyl-D-alanine carboxypeptidase [Clostridiaceae bacterium NSJ-31]|uniref:serine-type D-Ala-D-Ala carboxypeptidase n=1 Tax=Ligaoa zhengdingensis TaxID=2763658 RepID=A0A926DY80_9FIRM|nr:D-alanyl-D-alanine carboxypeptidase family protein [Ligaoa zhengdingensis]MBC8546296.1 D-alanyl-D-alanine carboxypeptidase [Ligaoa zhengdingensis]